MIAELELFKKESAALRGVSSAFNVVCPRAVSEDPVQIIESERLRIQLLTEVKQHIFETLIRRGVLDFDPEEAIRGYLRSFGL